MVEITGYLAGLIGSAAAVPQLSKTLKTRCAGDLSLPFLLMVESASILWIVYGVQIDSLPVIIPNVFIGFTYLGLIWLKINSRD